MVKQSIELHVTPDRITDTPNDVMAWMDAAGRSIWDGDGNYWPSFQAWAEGLGKGTEVIGRISEPAALEANMVAKLAEVVPTWHPSGKVHRDICITANLKDSTHLEMGIWSFMFDRSCCVPMVHVTMGLTPQ